VVERVLAEDCVWVLEGRVLTKSQAAVDAKNGPGDFLSDHLDYAEFTRRQSMCNQGLNIASKDWY